MKSRKLVVGTAVIILTLFLPPVEARSQNHDTLNFTDGNGWKQGHWIRRYPDSTIMYDGFFKNNKPIGEFRRYSEDSKLKSLMIHREDTEEVKVTFYHPNEFIAAEGVYINQKKEGKWRLYSQRTDKYLICEEFYENDLRNGLSTKYYKDGKTAERISYIDDVKHGEWLQYYVTGNLCIKGFYVDGKLHGAFDVLYANGSPEYKGQYSNDVRDGIWKVFKEDGSLEHEMVYKLGVLNDPELAQKETDFLDQLEKNKGKIADPEITGTIWN
jgi:antitoxin component YwqK of YwqJK toxin-antitoxin module